MNNWFSNFKKSERPIIYQGITYYTVENFFQAMKTLNESERAAVAKMTPRQAKKHCNALELREDWERVKVSVMAWALRQKFEIGTNAARRLSATRDAEIVEYNTWHDNYWGFCTCPKCAFKTKRNWLGVLLMQIRCENEKKETKGNASRKVQAGSRRGARN